MSYCEELLELIRVAEGEKWDLEFIMKKNDQDVRINSRDLIVKIEIFFITIFDNCFV